MSSTNYIRPNQPQPPFSFRGARLLETINRSANPEFAVWHWLNIVQDNPVKFVTARLWPPPTTSVPEELRFRRRRDRKSKVGATGNTGPSAAVASTIRSFEVLPADGCAWYPDGVDHSPGFLVRDAGEFHQHGVGVGMKDA